MSSSAAVTTSELPSPPSVVLRPDPRARLIVSPGSTRPQFVPVEPLPLTPSPTNLLPDVSAPTVADDVTAASCGVPKETVQLFATVTFWLWPAISVTPSAWYCLNVAAAAASEVQAQ